MVHKQDEGKVEGALGGVLCQQKALSFPRVSAVRRRCCFPWFLVAYMLLLRVLPQACMSAGAFLGDAGGAQAQKRRRLSVLQDGPLLPGGSEGLQEELDSRFSAYVTCCCVEHARACVCESAGGMGVGGCPPLAALPQR
mgnify:CR=1 FL=1